MCAQLEITAYASERTVSIFRVRVSGRPGGRAFIRLEYKNGTAGFGNVDERARYDVFYASIVL